MRTASLLRALVLASVPSLWVIATTTPAAAQPAPSAVSVKKASDHYVKGSQLFDFKRYTLALEEFKKSYAVVPSPNSRLYIARCYAVLDRPLEAYVEFDKVVAEAEERVKGGEDKYTPTLESARTERDEAAGKISFVTVNVNGAAPDAVLKIGGTEVPRGEWGKPVPLAPGDATVVLESGSKPPISEPVTLAAGEKKSVTIEAGPKKSVTEPGGEDGDTPSSGSSRAWLRPYAYVAAGVGVVGFAAFAVGGAMSKSTYSDLEDTCGGPCPQDREDDVSAGKTQQTIANIGLIVGAVGVAGGVTLFLLSMDSGEPEKGDESPTAKRRPSSKSSASSSLVVGPGFVGVRGQF